MKNPHKEWVQFVNRAIWKRHFETPKKKITKGAFGRSRWGIPQL